MKTLLATLIIAIISLNLQAQSLVQPRLEMNFYGLGDYNISVSEFPLSFRSVPLHADDGYLSGYSNATEPLPDSKLLEQKRLTGAFAFTYYPLTYIGCGVMIHTESSQKGDGWPYSDTEGRFQQNQWGTSSRKYGSSLRWYEIRRNLTVYKFNLNLNSGFYRLWGPIALRGKAMVIWDPIGRDLAGQNGWDRFGGDQEWQEVSLGRFHENAGVLEFNLALYYGSDGKKGEDLEEGEKKEKPSGLYLIFGISRYYQWYSLPEDVHVDMANIQKWLYSVTVAMAF